MRHRIARFKVFGALAMAGALSTTLFAEDRQLVNAWDVRDEIKLAPGVNPASVKEYFPSFYDYLDTGDFARDFAFTKDLGAAFLGIYPADGNYRSVHFGG